MQLATSCDLKYWAIFGALSESEDKPPDQLRFRDVIQEWMDRFELTEAAAIDAIRQRAALEPWLFGHIIGECIKEYVDMRSANLIPEPVLTKQPPALQPIEGIPTQDSRLPAPPAPANSQPATCHPQRATCTMQTEPGISIFINVFIRTPGAVLPGAAPIPARSG
jgi:hypothetical protein